MTSASPASTDLCRRIRATGSPDPSHGIRAAGSESRDPRRRIRVVESEPSYSGIAAAALATSASSRDASSSAHAEGRRVSQSDSLRGAKTAFNSHLRITIFREDWRKRKSRPEKVNNAELH